MNTIEDKAKAYADRVADNTSEVWHFMDEVYTELKDAYLAGATEALTAQWRSVEDGLPEIDEEVVVIFTHPIHPNHAEKAVAYFDGEDWYTIDGDHIRPTHWMNIPELPKTDKK